MESRKASTLEVMKEKEKKEKWGKRQQEERGKGRVDIIWDEWDMGTAKNGEEENGWSGGREGKREEVFGVLGRNSTISPRDQEQNIVGRKQR